MLETFLSTLGSFQNAAQSTYSVQNLYAPTSVKKNSTAHIISGIFQNFKKMQGLRLYFIGMKLTEKELNYRAFPGNF